MIKRTSKLVAIMTSLCLPALPQAQQVDGNELLETCTSENQALAGFCIGYINGYSEGAPWGAYLSISSALPEIEVSDANEWVGVATKSCVPKNATNDQLKQVFLKYVSQNPETRHESARYLIWRAYSDAFPCRLSQL